MHKSGFINIIGNPNVGKSTLMNNLIGEKLSIITSKAQTTRHRILGIVNGDNFQLIFSDTPGIIKPSYELQNSMMDFVKSALEDADVILYMLEIGEKSIKDSEVHNKIQSAKIPTIILLNKIDLSNQEDIENEIKPVVISHGCELWGIELLRGKKRPTIRVYIDAIAGATIDDCEKVAKDLNYELALNDAFIDQDYILEVSTPGIAVSYTHLTLPTIYSV